MPYDYESVMHYGAFTFAKNYSYPVIETKDKSEQSKIGQRRGLNFQDIHLITHMYKCTGKKLLVGILEQTLRCL